MPYLQFTTSRSVARPPLLQRGCRRFDSSLVDCGRSRSGRHAGTWPRKKPVRVRPVTPSPSLRGIWRSAGSHTPCARVRSPPPPPRAGSATGCAAPLQGEGCGFDSRSVHPTLNADVAQPGEARRSDRRQCRFESDRQYPSSGTRPPRRGVRAAGPKCVLPGRASNWMWRNGSAPALGAGGWEFESLHPDRCEVVQPAPRLALNQEIRVRILASQLDDDAPQPSRPDAQAGVPSPLKRVVAGSNPAARHHIHLKPGRA